MKWRSLLLVPVLLGVAVPPALAHAMLDHAVPAVGSTVPAPPQRLQLFFTEPLEPRFSGVTLTSEAGRAVETGAASVDPQNAAEMVLTVPALAPGKYKVNWHAVSTDTHRTEGSFTFEIRH